MAGRCRTGHRDRSRRVTVGTIQQDFPWPHIQALIDHGGNISIGQIYPIPCAAVASDEHNLLAALVRREGEGLIDILNRLDASLDAAFTHEIYTDEING